MSEAKPAIIARLGQFYIDGAWVKPLSAAAMPVIDPSTEQLVGALALGDQEDAERAIAAARGAFSTFAATSVESRIALLERIAEIYRRRMDEMAHAISLEMGAPMSVAMKAQAPVGVAHIEEAAAVLRAYVADETMGRTLVTHEPIGVCSLITPWNWPMSQIGCKVGPAIAAGCTMVLKPSEYAPLSALLFAEILDEAGVPAGVFNLVNGTGEAVGAVLSRHPDVDMVSFTGSNRAGVAVAKAAAETVKRVHQELGGKSPNILLDDADFAKVVPSAVRSCFHNSGQSCNAPTRLLVPESRLAEVEELARAAATKLSVGSPAADATFMGPLVNAAQFGRVQGLIEAGIGEGADLLCGGTGRPEGLEHGYYVRPTVFSKVSNSMRIAREEIFGPVLCIIPYSDEAEAISIANDTRYGLAAYVSSSDSDRAIRVARQLRAGMVHLNGASSDYAAPFGGYKASGNGSERGKYGFMSYLEVKSIYGHG